MRSKKSLSLAGLLLAIAVFLLSRSPLATSLRQQARVVSPDLTGNGLVKVARVIDGDTIQIEGGQKVRYIGMDTPESVDPRKPVQCFGKEATTKNRELVSGRQVRLERDVSNTDKYHRLLRYVYVLSNKPGGQELFVNLELVQQGFAHAATFPPDVKYQDIFLQAQSQARQENRGLWSACQESRS